MSEENLRKCGLSTNEIKSFGSGKTDHVKEWLEEAEHIFDMCQIPNRTRINIIVTKLADHAKIRTKLLIRNKSSWEEFKTQMMDAYHPANHNERIFEKIIRLRQEDTFVNYNVRFETLWSEIDSDMDKTQIHFVLFMRGLQDRVKEELYKQQVTTHIRALSLGKNFDRNIKPIASFQRYQGNSQPHKSNMVSNQKHQNGYKKTQ